jgi:hypothetical protein
VSPQEHRAQKDMVIRSLLVSAVRSERSEERPRKHVQRLAPPVFVDAPAHVFVIPTVNERRL